MRMERGTHTQDPGAVVRMPPMPPPPPSRKAIVIGMFAVVGIVVLVIGIAIGRATVDAPETPTPPDTSSQRGRLKVLSTPAESNVLLDGRFVGVAPLENLDLDPGKHSVVIDVFGYQPYSGTIEVEPRGRVKLSVVLAPLHTSDTSIGNVSGGGTARAVTVPRSALLPPKTTAPADPKSTASAPASTPRAPVSIPQRPRRDCSGENRTCRDGCSRADSDCRFSCPGCSSCLTSVGWDECKRQCDSCRNGCEQNKKFCESSCSSQQSNCEATQ
jgi:hypothetical protein